MQILLTNDDGYRAPGIHALKNALGDIGKPIILAPLVELSGCGHRVTTHQPLKLEFQEPELYSLDGTPADCVRVGLHSAMKNVDWVFSGINSGGNLGVDVFISGTVAAVREGAIHGSPGMAFSQYRKKGLEVDWALAARWAKMVANRLMQESILPGEFWNVNFPHLERPLETPELVFCKPSASPLPLDFKAFDNQFQYSGDYHSRHHLEGTDVEACFSGRIAISKLGVF
ncbi:MAG: 5'/3'-nucleotidase SurE [Planctomycetia bacterium]